MAELARRVDLELNRMIFGARPWELSESLRIKLVNGLWRSQHPISSSAPSNHIKQYTPYFDFFRAQCKAWELSGAPIAIQTFQDLLDLAQHLLTTRAFIRSSPEVNAFFPPGASDVSNSMPTPQQLLLPVAQRFPQCNELSILNSIDFTVCLWLMLNVGSRAFPGRSNITWSSTQTLDSFISSQFPRSAPGLEKELQWPRSFNAKELQKIGGFDIIWTEHLADHLALDEDLATISIYHHASVLVGYATALPAQ
jgi:hypothetical protein